jgi:hypothetical protein
MLRFVLAGGRKAPGRRRVIPRVSKATGGLMPGIDLTSVSALQETDDLYLVRLMKSFK